MGSSNGGSGPGNLRIVDLLDGDPLPADLCLTPHGTPFTESSLGVLQGSSLGSVGGVAVGQLSGYVAVAPGDYDIGIMNGGEQDGCMIGYPTSGGPITVPASGLVTIAMIGTLDTSFSAKLYFDDPGEPQPPPQIRLIAAVINSSGVDVGSGFGPDFVAAASGIGLGGIGALAGADLAGYAPVPDGFSGTIVAKLSGGPTLFIGDGFDLPATDFGTLFLLGEVKQSETPAPAIAVLCDESSSPGASGLYPCTRLNAKAMLRLVQLIPDVGPLDLCVANPDAGTAQVATLAGAPNGIDYAQSSAYVPVPADYGISTSDLILVPGGGGCADQAVLKLPGQPLVAGTYNTLVAEGLLDGGPFVPRALLLTPDEESAPPDVIADGGATVRFQTGAIGFSPAQGGTGIEGAQFNAIFYDTFGTAPQTALTDANGYTTLIPTLSNTTFTVYNPGVPATKVSNASYDLPASGFVSSATSLFLIGIGVMPQPYQTLQVDDQAAPVNGLLPTTTP